MTLNCTADQVENLFTPPSIRWFGPDGTEVPIVATNGRQIDPQTGMLIFSDITASNRGTYTCRAVVNIPETQIFNYFDESTVEVNTDGELATVNMKA